MSTQIKFTALCTSCRKSAELSPEQIIEARDIGCAFSACCGAVATVSRVTLKTSRESRGHAKRKADDAKYLQPGWKLPEVHS